MKNFHLLMTLLIMVVWVRYCNQQRVSCNWKDKSLLTMTEFHPHLDRTMRFAQWESRNVSVFQCTHLCRKEPDCLSFSHSASSEECYMYAHDSETAPEYLEDASGYVFYDMVRRNVDQEDSILRCQNPHRCINGGICKNDCSEEGYHCVCPDTYHGKYCGKGYFNDFITVQTILVPGSRGQAAFTWKDQHYLIVGGFADTDETGNNMAAPTSVYRYDYQEGAYRLIQQLTETGQVSKLEAFVLTTKQYVFIATYQVFGGSRVTSSHLYVYDENSDSFAVHQTFATQGAWSSSSIRTYDGHFYLFIGDHNGNSYNVDSVMYKWYPKYELFFEVEKIATKGACTTVMFEIDEAAYLAIPFYYGDSLGYAAESQVWKRTTSYDSYIGCYLDTDDRAMTFYTDDPAQTIEKCIAHCLDLDYPYAGLQYGSYCFCGDNDYDKHGVRNDGECNSGCTGNGGQTCGAHYRTSVYSTAQSWSMLQTLSGTSAAGSTGAVYFNSSGTHYLVVSNHHDGSSCTQDAAMFAWNANSEAFEEHQSIEIGYCSIDLRVFKKGGRTFMITSNLRQNPSVIDVAEYRIKSTIFILEGTKFIEYKTIDGIDVWDWTIFERDNELFLIQSSEVNSSGTFSNTTLTIYQWV